MSTSVMAISPRQRRLHHCARPSRSSLQPAGHGSRPCAASVIPAYAQQRRPTRDRDDLRDDLHLIYTRCTSDRIGGDGRIRICGDHGAALAMAASARDIQSWHSIEGQPADLSSAAAVAAAAAAAESAAAAVESAATAAVELWPEPSGPGRRPAGEGRGEEGLGGRIA
jgi:hypothetical protein